MTWEFTADVEEYADRAWPLLAARAAENTVALTVIEYVRAGRRWSDDPMLFGWYAAGGEIRGAVSLTPPYEMLLAEVPDDALDKLVEALLDRAAALPGVSGTDEIVDRFVAGWSARSAQRATTAMRQRLYALDTLHPPAPAPAGRARAAGEEDLDGATAWIREFQVEAGTHVGRAESLVRDWTAAGRLWLWEDPSGRTVSLAGRSIPTAGVARVGPVYTPPAHRRRGYGAAVTAACTAHAQRDAEQVVLFTDLANPTSNAIYQQIGFRPVSDRKLVRFGPPVTVLRNAGPVATRAPVD